MPLGRVSQILSSLGAVWVAVAGLYVVSGLLSPAMFSTAQVINILQVASFLGVIAAGQTIVILTGGSTSSTSRPTGNMSGPGR